jgi:hypothetical protein
MQAFDANDVATAAKFYRAITDENARRLLDNMIDHPDEQRTAADLQAQLGLAEHRDVARATYQLGLLAAELGRSRPWGEGQMGYRMSQEMANLFQTARAQNA